MSKVAKLKAGTKFFSPPPAKNIVFTCLPPEMIWRSNIEEKIYNIAVFNNIIFALNPEKTFFSGTGITTEANKVVIMHHFGTDETPFDIAVDTAGCLRGTDISWYRPGTAFILTGRQKANEPTEVK